VSLTPARPPTLDARSDQVRGGDRERGLPTEGRSGRADSECGPCGICALELGADEESGNVPALELELLSIETLTTQVSHRLGSFETELWLAIEGYRAERTKARNQWLTLAHLYNDLRPRQQAILRSGGVDVSANRQGFVIWEQGVSDLQDPPSQPEAGEGSSGVPDPAPQPEIRLE
jgi:hypothetical protein